MSQIFETTWQFIKVQRALYIEFSRVARMEKISQNSHLPEDGECAFDFYDRKWSGGFEWLFFSQLENPAPSHVFRQKWNLEMSTLLLYSKIFVLFTLSHAMTSTSEEAFSRCQRQDLSQQTSLLEALRARTPFFEIKKKNRANFVRLRVHVYREGLFI